MQEAFDPVGIEGFNVLVAWGGIEPPTRGFSIRTRNNGSMLIEIDYDH
jgi:hypothetical protein